MFGSPRGRCAVFTGPVNSLSATVARRLGNEGIFLVCVGRNQSENPWVRMLLAQFRSSAALVESSVASPAEMARAIWEAEQLAGRVELVIHALGAPETEDRGDAIVMRDSMAPLKQAMTCSRGAMDYLRNRVGAHIVHLVSASQIGAMEVEKAALSRLGSGTGGGSRSLAKVSAVYFDETEALPSKESAREARVLESFTGRLLEEDGWAERVMLEKAIGDLVMGVCRGDTSDFHARPGRAPLENRQRVSITSSYQEMMYCLMA